MPLISKAYYTYFARSRTVWYIELFMRSESKRLLRRIWCRCSATRIFNYRSSLFLVFATFTNLSSGLIPTSGTMEISLSGFVPLTIILILFSQLQFTGYSAETL